MPEGGIGTLVCRREQELSYQGLWDFLVIFNTLSVGVSLMYRDILSLVRGTSISRATLTTASFTVTVGNHGIRPAILTIDSFTITVSSHGIDLSMPILSIS